MKKLAGYKYSIVSDEEKACRGHTIVASASYKEKSIITLAPSANGIKQFSL
jgi:hypothetical protein